MKDLGTGQTELVLPRRRRLLVRPVVAFAAIVACFALTGVATAGPTTNSTALPVASGSADLGGYSIKGFEPATASVFNLNVTANATWSGSLTTDVGWDTNKVRQGATLDVSRVASTTSGSINVTWTITGTISPLGLGDIDIGSHQISASNVTCNPTLSGGGYSCTATSGGVTLIETPGIPLSPYVKMAIQVEFDITPTGAVVGRNFTIGGTPIVPPANLSLSDSPQTESLQVPCSSPAGSSVSYGLSPVDWTPTVTATQQPVFQIGTMDPGYALGFTELPPIFSAPFGSPVVTTPNFDLNGSGETIDMGSLLPNNVSPTIAPFSDFSGNESTPIDFSATTTSQCPITSYVWQFSDGTTSYGPNPERAFDDGGVYSGQLTVTDSTGLSATQSFTVDVANVAPTVDAGPDTSADWGVPVAFNGQAVAGGSDDQSTLDYTWTFGDGTPSASGGPNVKHAYATPGSYTATLKVCDEDGLCSSDSRLVTVTKRDTTLAYTGPSGGTYQTPGTLTASLVDSHGSPVNSGTVVFQVGTDGPFSALTGSGGVAVDTYVPTLAAGAYNVSATFAGNSLYNASSSATNPFSEAREATTTVYTGATTGKPNKAVALSATVTSATGTRLAGKTVVFQIGTQTASAVTNASGVAATTLTLNQKNGTYTVSATYAGDASFYIGSAGAAAFSLQTK